MPTDRSVVDTNVLVYAFLATAPQHAAARRQTIAVWGEDQGGHTSPFDLEPPHLSAGNRIPMGRPTISAPRSG